MMKEKTNKNYNKKAILVVSSGTAYREAVKVNIESCELKIVRAFPDYDIRRALTFIPC
jgi:cobalamin biosynthesis Co2+ chelatase CbiK